MSGDVTELSSVELVLFLLNDFALLDASESAEWRRYILSHEWLRDDSLADPLERYAAHLLRIVIWGHSNAAFNGPTRDASPLLAEQYRGKFHERVFLVAQKPPPWPRAGQVRVARIGAPHTKAE
jgi:hypothetical protein